MALRRKRHLTINTHKSTSSKQTRSRNNSASPSLSPSAVTAATTGLYIEPENFDEVVGVEPTLQRRKCVVKGLK
jgi:hypothetical protein